MIRDRNFIVFLLVATVALVAALVLRPSPPQNDPPAAATPEAPTTFQAVCASCHGSRGEGNRDLMAPTIASLPEWFLSEQLTKFRTGIRGTDPRDVHGQQMRAAVLPLSAEAIAEAVAEILALTAITPTATLGGDPGEGFLSYRNLCMECHRFNGHGELAFKSSPLAGLPDWYLAAQFEKFLDGSRGSHPDDVAGAKMREMAQRPRNQEELTNILSFVATLATEFPIEK